MKKWFIGILLLIITGFVLCIYLLLPSKFVISRSIPARVTTNGAFRVLSNDSKWKKWWRNEAGQVPGKGDSLIYNGYTFRVIDHETNVVGVEITKGKLRLKSIMHLVNFRFDSTVIIWKTDPLPAGLDPITRLLAFKKAIVISESMKGILQKLKPYLSNPLNVYDVPIYWTADRDSTMLMTRFTSPAYPTTTELYGYFDVLKKSIQRQNGTPVSYPMMNVRKLENGLFETQVAIPTDRRLKDDGKILSRKMVPSKFIYTIVTGGVYTTNEAMEQLEFFIADNNKMKIANPFQMPVTDRTKEPDTLKWVTKIYIPVVQ
jgi:hypothetical protein